MNAKAIKIYRERTSLADLSFADPPYIDAGKISPVQTADGKKNPAFIQRVKCP